MDFLTDFSVVLYLSSSSKILFQNSNWKIVTILPITLSVRILEVNASDKSGVVFLF